MGTRTSVPEKELDGAIDEVLSAAKNMSRDNIGALIVFEREVGLGDYIDTGIAIDGVVSRELLENIFVPNTPLHDGAVIIRGHRIMSAGCLLPLTADRNLSTELGTRHRAAIGLSEQTDAVVLVVSEETGKISYSYGGHIYRHLPDDKIKEALNSLNDYDPPREYGTPFANALMMHTSYKEFNEITYRAITLQQLKTLTKQASPELYEKYFSKDNPDPSAIQIKVNSVLRQLFWNTDGQENLSTKGIQIEAIYNGNIYFNIQPSTFETKYGYTIASKEAYPHQEQEYKGYNIYSAVINGTTKFMVARGVFTDQNVGKTYDNLQQARDFIDKSFKEDILKKGLLLDLYMPNEHGVQFNLSTHNSTILPGQVIRAINVQINSKAFTKEIQNYNSEQGLKFIQKHNDTIDTTQLDSLEKILLTAAKVQEDIDKGIQEDLTEFVDNLNNYNYYYVNNVDQSQGLQYTIQLQQIPNVRSTTSSPIGWVSMPQRLTYFANKIESRFGIPTQILNKQAISEKYGAKFPNKDISKEKAFIIDNTIVINLELATKQDVAHEYMHVFMGIVKSQPDLQEDYFALLQELVENTEQGQQQLQQYQNVSEYSDMARIDLYEEVAANIMGEYLSDLNPNTYPRIFRDFRKFIQNNTFNQDLKENILDFTDFAVNSSYKINTNSKERQITNFLKAALQNKIIQEIC